MRSFIIFMVSVIIGSQALAMASSTIVTVIKEKINLPRMGFDFDDEEISEQANKYQSQVKFHHAALKALESFMTHEKTGPLFDAIEEVGESASEKHLHNLLNDSDTVFGHLRQGSDLLPFNGEEIAHNWIFFLGLDEMDKVYWAIVDRAGEKDVYNYGKSYDD